MSAALCRERLERFAEPILVLELRRFRRHASLWSVVVLAFLVLALPIALLLDPPTLRDMREFMLFGSLGCLLLMLVLVPAYGARSIRREREMGTWDMLAVTPMPSSHIADQKILAAAMPVLLLLVGGLPMAVALTALGAASIIQAGALAVVLTLGGLIASAATVEYSSSRGFWRLGLVQVACGAVLMSLLASWSEPGPMAHEHAFDAQFAWLRALVIAAVSCAILILLFTPLVNRRFPKGHPRRRQAVRLLNIGALCTASVYLIPAVRVWALDAFRALVGLACVCSTPIAAVRQLCGESVSSYRGTMPGWFFPYSITVGTLLIQMAALVFFRQMAAGSIERLRRAE